MTDPPDSQAEPSTKAVVKFDNSIHVDTKGLKGKLKALPARSELAGTINESMVIELYSK